MCNLLTNKNEVLKFRTHLKEEWGFCKDRAVLLASQAEFLTIFRLTRVATRQMSTPMSNHGLPELDFPLSITPSWIYRNDRQEDFMRNSHARDEASITAVIVMDGGARSIFTTRRMLVCLLGSHIPPYGSSCTHAKLTFNRKSHVFRHGCWVQGRSGWVVASGIVLAPQEDDTISSDFRACAALFWHNNGIV